MKCRSIMSCISTCLTFYTILGNNLLTFIKFHSFSENVHIKWHQIYGNSHSNPNWKYNVSLGCGGLWYCSYCLKLYFALASDNQTHIICLSGDSRVILMTAFSSAIACLTIWAPFLLIWLLEFPVAFRFSDYCNS